MNCQPTHDAPVAWWIVLLANAFAWPHVARMLALRSANPRHAELRILMMDSTLGGMWIAVMQFNPLPSATGIVPSRYRWP
jgi:diguanylate cyclase